MNYSSSQPGPAERAIAAILLAGISPILMLGALAIAVVDGLPVVFRQQRAGLRGHPFEVLKLRTMRRDAPAPHELGQVRRGNALVLPGIGGVLRRIKLDEAPQLLNVVRGEMRFVGPRPALVGDLAEYSPWERRRLDMPPGMTGWAQVNGNTELSWPDRIALDIYYVDHRSVLMDLRILLMTFLTVLRGEQVDYKHLQEARHHAARLVGSSAVDGGGAANTCGH